MELGYWRSVSAYVAHAPPMPFLTAFLILTVFIFLAIVGGIVGIILEGRRIDGTGAHNPATHDTVFPIVGWAALFLIYLLVEYVGAQNLTPQFRTQLGTLAALPFFYAMLATGRLIWRSARRIAARLSGHEPVTWRAVPFLSLLRFPILLAAAVLSLALEFWGSGFTLSFLLLASIAVLLALVRKSAPA